MARVQVIVKSTMQTLMTIELCSSLYFKFD